MIAVTGKTPLTIHSEIGVIPTGQHAEVHDYPIQGAVLPNDDYLLCIHDWSGFSISQRMLRRLSTGASLIECYLNEGTMFSAAAGWSHGKEQWSVYHDCQEGSEHLESTGTLPPELQPIRDRLFAQQHEHEGYRVDDIFDIPTDLFAALVGFRYDKDISGVSPITWEIMQYTKTPWWKFW